MTTRKQFKDVQVGEIFSRPSIGIQAIYRKTSMETDKAPGKAEIRESFSCPAQVGRVVTISRGWVVDVHEEDPITDAVRKSVGNYYARPKSKGLRRRGIS